VRELWSRLRTAFDNLSSRERALLAAAGGLIALGLLYVAVVMPALATGGRVTERRVAAEQQLDAMLRLRREYDDVSRRLGSVEERIQSGSKGNLRTTLEELASRAGVKVESMEPQATPANDRYRETKVEVGLGSVTLAQTVNYLHQIESANQVLSVKSLRIRARSGSAQLLDVTFTVSSFEPL
jgi:type II secretory pathway component PulM